MHLKLSFSMLIALQETASPQPRIFQGGILDFLGWRGLADPCLGGEHNLVSEKGFG